MKAAEKHGSLHLANDDDGGAGEPTAEGQAPLDFEDVGGQVIDDEDDPTEEKQKQGVLLMDKATDATWIKRLLAREAEIALSRKPGRPADAHKAMRSVADAFGSVLDELLAPFEVQEKECLHFSSEAASMLQAQTSRAADLRARELGEDPAEDEGPPVVLESLPRPAPSADLIDVTEKVALGPAKVAWELIEKAELTADQIRAVALVAKPMEDAWEKLSGAAEPARGAVGGAAGNPPCLPKVGKLVRLVLVGGGGCGKTRIINKVLKPLLKTFYGDRGVLTEASSNKAARLIQGKTLHAANKLQGTSSLRTVHLRITVKQQKALGRVYGELGAKILDEFSQTSAKLLHADAYRTTMARAALYSLQPDQYAQPDQTWGALPVVCVCGDELQLPPVPFESSLLAPLEGVSDEQKAGVAIFSNLTHAYRLTTQMRFDDPVLVSILAKMRTEGGATLTPSEWRALEATEVKSQADLQGTELWYQAAYEWSIVTMAMPIRSVFSARQARATLFVIQAEDDLLNPWAELQSLPPPLAAETKRRVGEAALRHPNMNETGRMPGFVLIHMGMQVRLTQTVEQPDAVVDSTGVVTGIDFHALEPRSHREAAHRSGATEPAEAAVVVLKHQPICIYVRLDENDTEFLPPQPCDLHAVVGAQRACSCCRFFPGVLAVKPRRNDRPWSIEAHVNDNEVRKVNIARTQVPLACILSSTLHVLQGATADPGMIFHWTFPRRLRRDMRWLTIYVALSRVRGLRFLRSIGMNSQIREIIEEGPPQSLPAQFQKLFAEKEKKTFDEAVAAVAALGWDGTATAPEEPRA